MISSRQIGISFAIALAVLVGSAHFAPPAHAADYSNSNMMDDGTFNDVNSMGATVSSLVKPAASEYAQVTNFLKGTDGKLSTASPCLANHTDQNWYYDGTNFHFGNDADWNPAWGPAQVPAAQLIYTTAHMWGMNPQVLISTLQKEESLITGTDCAGWRYNSAMGYGCPDSGGCNPKYVGFTRQIFWASWQLEYSQQRSEGNLGWLGNGDLTYGGYFSNGVSQSLPYRRCNSCSPLPNAYTTPATIDGQSITVANGATAALFSYTPHLNQSFPGIFERWFGSVIFHGSDPVGSLDLVQQVPSAVRVAGWGLDRSLTGPAAIHVYIDGTWVGAITADINRADVGAHGFDGTVPWTAAGTHQLCAWVVGDNIGAPNYGLGCKSVSINNDPTGSLDLVQPTPGAVRLAGWGLDRSLAGPAAIHVYIDGTWVGAITANINRADVGAHGFDGTVPWTTAGTHQACAWVVGDSLGAANYGLGCRPLTINNDPIGGFDLVQQTPGTIRTAGWGLDRSLSGSAVIHVYVDGMFTGAITANTSRPDVGGAYPALGNNHGFDGTVSFTTAGNHQVCTWVIGDNLGAPNAGLGCRPITINNDPVGSLDIVQTTAGAVRLAGWGLDRSLASSAAIHAYIDGTFVGAITANINRSDVGAHGYDGTVPWTASGTHQVCVWVVGDNLGAPNAGLGCRQFTY